MPTTGDSDTGVPRNSHKDSDKPPDLVKVANAVEKPPKESEESKWRRRYVLLSFWLLVLLVGVPFWWNTTTVYRANLPYSTMDSWAEGEVGLAVEHPSVRLIVLGLRLRRTY